MTTFTYYIRKLGPLASELNKPRHSFVFKKTETRMWRNRLMPKEALLTELVENFLMMVLAVHNMAAN